MPDHKIHETLDYLIFGRAFPDIHDYLDSAQPILQSNHRLLYHDAETVEEIRALLGEVAATAALYHIILDQVSDKVGQEKAIPVFLSLLQ